MSIPQVTPSEATALLVQAIPEHEPVFLVGAPGIGKSSVIEQAIAQLNAERILSHPAVWDPTNISGFPFPNRETGTAEFLPFGDMARALAAKDLTAWFFDDMGQGTWAVQAGLMQLFLAREVNGHVLPDCVSLVAASNRRTDRANVQGILETMKSRMITIVELIASLDDWCQWAFANGMPADLIAFLRFRSDLLSAFRPSADMDQSPQPRTWANVGRIVTKFDLPDKIQLAAMGGAVGMEAAAEYSTFRTMYAALPSVDAIILDPENAPIPDKPSVRYAIATALGLRANLKVFPRIARYAERLVEAKFGDIGAMLVRDCQRRDVSITHSPEYNRLASGPLGHLIGGAI